MEYWNEIADFMSFQEFCGIVSDFHKDCFGFRPLVDFNNKIEALKMALYCEEWLNKMRETPEGRAKLEAGNWILA